MTTHAAVLQQTRIQAAARHVVRKGLRRGELVRGECAHRNQRDLRGGCSGRIEAHHEDHTKPLEVVWLCLQHHRHLHGARAWGNCAPEEKIA